LKTTPAPHPTLHSNLYHHEDDLFFKVAKKKTVLIFQAIISRVIKLPCSLQYNRHETQLKTGREKINTDPERQGVGVI
jgi:hypothetical protein